MNRLKLLNRRRSILLILLLGYLFLPVYAQGQKVDSLTAVAKGQGVISSAIEERKLTGALAVLRQDGTVLITLYSDLQLQVQGTWSASNSSPEEILLKITAEANCSATGTGRLLLSNNRIFIKELTIKADCLTVARSWSHLSPIRKEVRRDMNQALSLPVASHRSNRARREV